MTQLTIKELLEKLATQTSKAPVGVRFKDDEPGWEEHHVVDCASYRGYNGDLALIYDYGNPDGDLVMTVKMLSKMLQKSIGKSFVTHKGDTVVMTDDSPVWVAPEKSNTGPAVVDVVECCGVVILVTEDQL